MSAAFRQMIERFLTTMFDRRHDTSWMTGDWKADDARQGKFFLYLTLDPTTADKAEAALRDAGLLCSEVLDGPQHFTGDPE